MTLKTLALLLAIAAASLVSQGAEARLRCAEVSFDVALTDGAPTDLHLAGELCTQGELRNKTIQILLHGGTYDRNYWDFPLQPARYSYVRWATGAGFATLNVDRLGVGASSKPDGLALNLHTNATAVHHVVQKLRSGTLNVAPFGAVNAERIILVGHSLGSFIASIEASTYHDVDGVILSGYAHNIGPGQAAIQAQVYPAALDPKFASSGLAPEYLTTLPGVRGAAFYNLSFADPAVIALDEVLKQTATLGEILDLPASLSATLGLSVPTLVINGEQDSLYCEAPSCTATQSLADEADFYPPEACAQIVTLPNTGHDLNLQRNAPLWFGIASLWAHLRVGADSRFPTIFACP